MITPDQFPYIKSLYVNDCYAYKDFNIELHDYKPFSHLILTGKNGSGKSTILRALDKRIMQLRFETNEAIDAIRRGLNSKEASENRDNYSNGLKELNRVVPIYQEVLDFVQRIKPESIWRNGIGTIVYSYVKAARRSEVNKVETVTKESDFLDQLIRQDLQNSFAARFGQYLVNKKVGQAFDQLNNNSTGVVESDRFFAQLTNVFRSIIDDQELELEFVRENFDFFLKLSNGRKITFNVLSEGYSALLNILMDLLVRVDLIRKQVGDYTYNPCGIVLIDEPETHLHLQLQEQVLPLLTSLFPNIQFIAATHSPAVIASIKQVTIFDLTTKETRISEDTAGRSYSDLMVSHFGLENEYSETADQIIKQVNDVLNTFADKPIERKAALQKIYDENSAYLSPTLKVELELLIAQQAAHQEVAR